ncbi:MAG: PKD domain-containing protein, partial [Bacteroidetes bacterium]|nr:PKD domain-containing protein [Bacteroidota bacterium]
SDTLAIEPKAIPDVMVTPSNLAICSGEGVNIDITTSSPGIVNFTFTANATDITGASSGIGDSIVQTLTATTSFAGTVDYSVVAEEDGCISNPVSALITVDPVFSATNVLTICSNDSVFADGSWQNTSGIYYDSLVSAAGCDSVIETQLTVNSTEFLANTASICPGDSIYLQNGWQTAAGVYYDSLLTSLSCDSVIETTVSLFTVPAFALVNDTTLTEGDTLVLTANGSWASVLWSSGSVTDTAWIHASGTYYAEVFTADGCQTSDTIVVTFTPLYQCNASFTYSVTGNTADFTNTSQGTISTTFWDFGDGQFVNDPATTFAHSFPGEGYYNVCLTIVDTLGSCFDDTCITVAVSPLPVNCNASFNYTSGGGATVLFNAGVSAGQLTNYFWDFGDGAVSYASSPTHTYPAEGYYTVELTVEDTVNDCISSKTRVIMAGDILNDCEADFTYHSMLEHKKVRFTNLSSGVNLDTYLWNFGDGSFANTPDAEHTFQTSAFYNVCLSVLSTSTGCANITCKTIKVGNDDHSCHATFVYAVDSTESKSSSGKKVDFKGTAFGDPAKTVWSILWNFGDGETDTTTLTPTHVYADSGLYQVTLKISSSYCTDLYFDLVNAGDWLDQIRGGFVYEIDTTSKSNQYPVDFKGAAFGDPAVISWEFGDGGMDSTTLSPNYVYAQPGDYNVCFTVADPNTGQSDTYCDSLHIDEITYLNTFGRAGIAADVYPNPAKSRAIIGYYLPESADVTVSIADIYGRTVDVLADNSHAAGNHTIFWNVENLKPGIYMVIIRSADEVITKRVVITR